MTQDELKALEGAAAKATPGERAIYRGENDEAIAVQIYVKGSNGGTVSKYVCRMPLPETGRIHPNQAMTQAEINANADLVKLTSPDCILSLLADLRSAQEERDRMAMALEPFAEASNYLHPSLPDAALTLDGIEVRHWRAARAALHLEGKTDEPV